ncbi:MAG: BTAD domain-containing putative transcriptional regulator [Armatimonas sp.]
MGTADEEVVLRASRASVALDIEQVASDVVELEACLRQASATPEQQREALDRALKLYENHLMPGFYETWVLSERDRLENRMRTALLQLTQSLQETEPDAAITYARTAVNLDPLDETAQENLLKLLVQTGRSTEALRHWKDVERLFWKELRTTPPPTLKAALDSIGTSLPAPESITVYPVVVERLLPRTLPASLDAFFGREREREQLTGLLTETGATRLVTLTGPPGVGKTRLALEVAQGLTRRNIVFVALENLATGEAALDAIYDAAGGRHESGPLLPALTRLLDTYQAPLLVLDNAEGVQGLSESLQALLQSVPELRCLVTSRQALRLPGEREMILEPLVEDTALQLLLDRARQARPDLSLTPQNEADFQGLCQDLEGLPLALELAAVWLRLLSPEQVRERLQKDLRLLARRSSEAGRHDSLYAAIEESVQRLSESERAILFRLAVFRGGWSLEAAEGVCAELSPLALARFRSAPRCLANRSAQLARWQPAVLSAGNGAPVCPESSESGRKRAGLPKPSAPYVRVCRGSGGSL